MNITVYNIPRVLGSNDPEDFSRMFEILTVDDQNPDFVASYTVSSTRQNITTVICTYEQSAIQQKLDGDFERVYGTLGLTRFGRKCVDAGMVKAMLNIAADSSYSSDVPKERYMGQYNALESLAYLMQCGDLNQRGELLDEMLKHDVIDICLRKLDHPLCVHRQQSINLLRVLSSESFLGQKISAEVAASIITAMCKFTLEGPRVFIDGLFASATTWQSRMFMGSDQYPASRAGRYVPRYYAMAQESALWAVHGLLCTSPPPPRKFCLDIIKDKPEIVDMLFDCTIIARPAWYPETQVDSIACEILALLFQPPLHIVPGVSSNVERDPEFHEWKQSLGKLTSREGWDVRIIQAWNKLRNEDIAGVRRLFSRVEQDYFAFEPPNKESFRSIFGYRGTSRIALLRLIANISHVAESLSNAQIESFLWIAYEASRKVKNINECHNESDMFSVIERSEEVFRSPMYTVSSNTTVDAPEQIAEERVLGPTALARLLAVLAQRNRLGKLQSLKKPTDGLSPSTSLDQVQQIIHPDAIKRFLKIALQRVKARMETGRKRDDTDHARAAYTSAAELAAALVALDTFTQGQYNGEVKGARKELVLALGSASEMALRSKKFHKALSFAMGAVTIADGIPTSEGLDSSVVSRNKQRVNQARAVVGSG
ncbi:hypothetical protein BV22DRAFT_1089743 [Leucogyrophana mollusca]|uniref:Uncharacterized protein n=1 Tax=Leucogyrophana mollusca TaxID=85980 RepID=A0ACB8BHP9_9AGAM|nr:hypothetical protein BV22DRAFT_1089743 [Leucogyrophana mollusca]